MATLGLCGPRRGDGHGQRKATDQVVNFESNRMTRRSASGHTKTKLDCFVADKSGHGGSSSLAQNAGSEVL